MVPGNGNARKELPPEVKQAVEEKLTEGWPFREITKTLGISYHMLRRHWPGRAWTHRQTIEHAITMRRAQL
jgi:DNA invertase Pin-like site-specific DNA recombinase